MVSRTASDGAAPAAIELVRLSKTIDQRAILHDLNLRVAPGEFVALLGANGAGKSTLLKILATLTAHNGGEARLFGEPLRRDSVAVRAKIGMVAHQSMLYKDLSARENLEFFAKLHGVADPAGRARRLLEAMGLGDRAGDAVGSFSRGMTQRVSIARAIVHNPALLLADEPFAGLDAPSTRAVEELLIALHASGRTIVLVNHDIPQTLRLVQRVIVLRAGTIAADRLAAEMTAEDVLAAAGAI